MLALMTAVAVFAVLWPLGRQVKRGPAASETVVYQDQLAEVTRDADSGLIGPVEAEAARIEISRRLLAAATSEEGGTLAVSKSWRRAVSIVALAGLPLLAAGLYLQIGSPWLPDFPFAARQQMKPQDASIERLIARVQEILEKNPKDGRGWSVLAPVLLKLGRVDEAVPAFRNALAYNAETAGRHADLGTPFHRDQAGSGLARKLHSRIAPSAVSASCGRKLGRSNSASNASMRRRFSE